MERARRGEGPSLVECKTYRYHGHHRADPRLYRTREEEAEWQARDPIDSLVTFMTQMGIATESELADIATSAQDAVEDAVEFALSSPLPRPEEVEDDVYAPAQAPVAESEPQPGARIIEYRAAIQEALREEMRRDQRVFLMGEDIGFFGGAYGATRGLYDEFGAERVRDTPISEAIIGGGAVGAAMVGMRPVAEIMYVDFTPLAMDQIANQGAKNRYMFGGKTTIPMVIRTQGGAGRSIAAHHSQSLEALWTHFPGIYVVMPATPYDAKGLLKSAIRNDNPVLFIEHKLLYGVKGAVPEEEYTIPLGVAKVKRLGTDVTVVAYSRMLHRVLEAAALLAKEGISAEVIDPRTLKPLDLETIVRSVQKTGHLVGVTEAYKMGSFIDALFARINEVAFDWLDGPMVSIAALDVPVPMSESLEDAAIPTLERIVQGIRDSVQ